MKNGIHKHHFVRVRGMKAYKCRCGVYYGKTRAGWMMKDYRLKMVGQPPRTVIERGRAIWAEVCGLFGGSK